MVAGERFDPDAEFPDVRPSHFLVQQNRRLEKSPNTRVNTAVRRVEEKLTQRGISDDCTVAASARTLSFR